MDIEKKDIEKNIVKDPLIDERKKKLSKNIAGENINYESFERYLRKAKPLTLSTLIKAVRVESYLKASKGEIDNRIWIILAVIIGIFLVIAVIWFLFFQPAPESASTLINGSL